MGERLNRFRSAQAAPCGRALGHPHDGPEEIEHVTRIGYGPAYTGTRPADYEIPAVTLAIAKRAGTNKNAIYRRWPNRAALGLGRRPGANPDARIALVPPLVLPPDRINLKAKTNEGLGELGRGEAVAAQVVVALAG